MSKKSEVKILLIDIETAPLEIYAWGIGDQHGIGLSQIKEDWSVLSWSAKWLDSKEIIYEDNRKSKDVRDDKKLLKNIHELLNEADIVVGQNSKKFDVKKLNARFIINGYSPVSSFKQIDTLSLAKKYFAFTSNKLEHLCNILGVKFKKLKSKEFPGMELWKECLKGNLKAWNEMEAYNKRDVLALQDVYHKMAPWGTGVDFDLYRDNAEPSCNCGSTKFQKNGFFYSSTGKFQRYKCAECGTEASLKGKTNNLLKDKILLKKG